MKKHYLFLLVSLFLVGCSSDMNIINKIDTDEETKEILASTSEISTPLGEVYNYSIPKFDKMKVSIKSYNHKKEENVLYERTIDSSTLETDTLQLLMGTNHSGNLFLSGLVDKELVFTIVDPSEITKQFPLETVYTIGNESQSYIEKIMMNRPFIVAYASYSDIHNSTQDNPVNTISVNEDLRKTMQEEVLNEHRIIIYMELEIQM